MRTTITLDNRLVKTVQEATGAPSKAKAVVTVIHDYLRRRKISKIKELKGKLKFDLTADEIRHAQR